MRTKAIIIWLLAVTLIQSACEPELVTSIDLPTEDRKLSVASFLEAGNDIHRVFVGGSIPNNVTVNGDPVVTDATVTVSDGQKKVTLQHTGMGYYTFENNDLAIIPGNTYYLEATAPGFPEKVASQCTVPGDFNPQFTFLSVDSTITDIEKVYELEFKFRDVAGIPDYYRIVPVALVVTPFMPDTMQWPMWTSSSRPLLFTDEGKDGDWIHFKASVNTGYFDENTEKLIGFDITIIRTDEAYYKFHLPFINGEYYGNDDGLFGEPTIIFSNIQKGYGIFSGLVRKSFFIPNS